MDRPPAQSTQTSDRASRKGLFITLEGGEGAGKSTLIKALSARLSNAGRIVETTREPGGTEGAEAIRALLVQGAGDRWTPTTEVLLFYAARQDHLDRKIRPALAAGSVVLCDRFADSTRAYQGAAGGTGSELVEQLDVLIVGETQPDLTLILDLPPEAGLARAASRGGVEVRFEGRDLSFHHALRAAYLKIATDHGERCVVLDATASAGELEAAAWAIVESRLHG